MAIEDILIKGFNENTSGKNYSKAQVILNNDLVSSIDITSEEDLICIDGKIISSNLFNEYHTTIEMEVCKKTILSTYCSCDDFEKNEFKKKNYCCEHLVATFYKALDDLVKNPLLINIDDNKEVFKVKNNILDLLLEENNYKDELRIDIYINRNERNKKISAEFKIGIKSMNSNNLYILKDIEQFLIAYNNKIPVKYSKNFTFNIKEQRLNIKDKRLIDFIENLKLIDGPLKSLNKNRDKNIEGKNINIPNYLMREFFEIIKNHRVYLNEGFFYRAVETEILLKEPNIEFDLKLIKSNYMLKCLNGIPTSLGDKGNVFIYGSSIYIPSYEFCYKVKPYLDLFNQVKVLTIAHENEDRVLRQLIPNLHLISEEVSLCKKIKDKIVMEPVKFNFYFNKENSKISLIVKVKYGLYEFNIFEDFREKIIYRDSKKELNIITILKSLGFDEINKTFYFIKSDDFVFKFFKYDIVKLQDLGEVYYSENFKGIKSIGNKGIKGTIKAGQFNYFEMEFKIADIVPEESIKILRAFRENLKYYKLKNGELLDLEELEIQKFLKLLDVVTEEEIDENSLRIDTSKALFMDNYLQKNNIKYIKGKSVLKEIRDKFKNIQKVKNTIPKELKANLRKYQEEGYNWFKTLDYLGLGGILADEMGLGKTLQAITFILSKKESKTLIVAPTSLIYNWVEEFEKFAPNLKVEACTGIKELREEQINKLENIDVIITTYNLLKRDFELYKNIEFDYCILDEAQYIKNSNSQNAITVKKISAKTKFALTGTPIENSLMELWSIFDFIMPGYLYDEKRFSVRYEKKLNESPEVIEELNTLIKPFILRRRKKEVIKELPNKIEKKLLISLNEEEKKIYSIYSNYALDLIEKKVKNEEFKKSKIEILSYITKLRQLCLDPKIVMEDYIGGSSKINALIELLHQSIESNHRVLIFSQFTSVLKNIAQRMNEENISFNYLDGTISSEKRMSLVKEFNKGNKSVFLISLKAGGTGLNLTSADVVIHFDPWWNPAVEEQATDRAHRIGQKNVVEVIKLISKGTIEEKVVLLQEQKKKLISKMIGDDLDSVENLSSLNEEEIISLFQ